MRIAKSVELTREEREILTRATRGPDTSERQVLRAKIVLAAAAGKRNDEIARELQCTRRTVGKWRTRFLELRVEGLEKDAPRSGRKPSVSDEVTAEVLRLTTQEKPPGQANWSTRKMARAVGVSHSTVSRIWKLHQLEPHLINTYEVPGEGQFGKPRRDLASL